jgi:hypothetical protein
VVLIIFGVGVGGVWWPASQSIEQVRAHARDLYEQANQNDAIVRRAAFLHAAEKRIHSDVLALGGKSSPGAVTAAMLRLLNEEARRLNIDVRTLTPATGAPAPQAQRALASGGDVSLGVRGPFRNVISFIADLPRHDVLIEIHNAQLSSADIQQHHPMLEVTINATIYRLRAL